MFRTLSTSGNRHFFLKFIQRNWSETLTIRPIMTLQTSDKWLMFVIYSSCPQATLVYVFHVNLWCGVCMFTLCLHGFSVRTPVSNIYIYRKMSIKRWNILIAFPLISMGKCTLIYQHYELQMGTLSHLSY